MANANKFLSKLLPLYSVEGWVLLYADTVLQSNASQGFNLSDTAELKLTC